MVTTKAIPNFGQHHQDVQPPSHPKFLDNIIKMFYHRNHPELWTTSSRCSTTKAIPNFGQHRRDVQTTKAIPNFGQHCEDVQWSSYEVR
jgi:hypothetical protein